VTKRRAEAAEARQWDGDVAAANELDEVRTWVVWGDGVPPEQAAVPETEERPGRPAGDVARMMAEGADPDWAALPKDERWEVLLEADEDDVDAWAEEDDSVRGFTPYLVAPEDAAATPEIQYGIMRPDTVRRRKAKRFDAARPE
jgi:hypothetical protein